eukprot:119627_1
MPCLTFRTARYYLPPPPLDINESSDDIISNTGFNKRRQLSSYLIFVLKCIAIFLLLNSPHYITKYVEDSNPTYYKTHNIDNIRSLQSFISWGLFTALWNIILSYNLNISNNKQKYKKIINEISESKYISKIQEVKSSKFTLFRSWHIYMIVFFHDCIAFMFLQEISIPYIMFPLDENSYFCKNIIKCYKFSINDLIHDGFGFCYVFLLSSLTINIFDIILCRRMKRNYLRLYNNNDSKVQSNELSTPLVSINELSANSQTRQSEIDMISYHHVEEIIHIQRPSVNKSESPIVWSTVPSTKPSLTTPIPSSFKNVSYLGNSNTINDSCINIWRLNILLSFVFILYFLGLQFIGHWQKDLMDKYYEKWTLLLLIYTCIWRYIMTRIGRMYDRLRIFSFTDHNSDLNTTDKKQCIENETQYFISMELILYVFVMSIYYIMMKVYLVYYEPSWIRYAVSLGMHIGSELLENGVRNSVLYYNLTKNLWFLMSYKHKNDVCMGKFIGLFRDESELNLWRERFSVDISIKIVISFLSCLAAILLNVCEYFGYLMMDNPKFTSQQCAMSALRVGISVVAELILYVVMYYLWYFGKGFLFEPFTRIISKIRDKNKFVWMFMASFIAAGLTYGGKNI